MSGMKEDIHGMNVTLNPLDRDSSKADGTDFSANSVSQALTNACIIVPAVCFLGAIVVVLLGVTVSRMNKTCDKCAALRICQEQSEESDVRIITPPVFDRVFWTNCIPKTEHSCDDPTKADLQPDVISQSLRGITNLSFDFSEYDEQNTQGICVRKTYPRGNNPERDCLVSDDNEFDASDASKIVHCSDSVAREGSVSSLSTLYHERIQNFLTDSVLIFHKTYNPGIVSATFDKRPASSSRSLGKLSTYKMDSTFSECGGDSFSGSSVLDIDQHSVSKIANCNETSFCGISHLSFPLGTDNSSSDLAEILQRAEMKDGMIVLKPRNYTEDSPTYVKVPPPSPNTDEPDDFSLNLNSIYLNKNPWLMSTRKSNSSTEEQNSGSWTTATSQQSEKDLSLEWDTYQPSFAGHFSDPIPRTPDTVVDVPDNEVWV